MSYDVFLHKQVAQREGDKENDNKKNTDNLLQVHSRRCLFADV